MPLERPQSAWLDFLEWVQEPQQAVSNAVRGRSGAAARHLADFLAGPIDAVLPGDVISRQAMPEDEIDATMLEKIALNPITWTAAVPGAGKAIGQGIRAAGREVVAGATALAPDAMAKAKSLADDTRRTLGWDTYEKFKLPSGREFIPEKHFAEATGIEQTAAQSGMQHLAQLEKVTAAEKQALADAIDNLDYTVGRVPALLDPLHQPTRGMPVPDQITAAKRRLQTWESRNPGVPIDRPKLEKLIDETYGFGERQLDEAHRWGALADQQAQPDYLMREYRGLGGASAGKGRELNSADKVIEFLKANPDVELVRDWQSRMAGRAQKQGRMLKRAYLREQLTDPVTARRLLNRDDDAAKKLLNEALAAGKMDSDTVARLKFELEGMAPPGRFGQMAQSLNRVFKPAAVYGVGPFVRVGSIVRNQLTAYWQLAGTPEGRAYMMRDPAAGIRNLVGAFDDGVSKNLFGSRITGGEITQSLDMVEGALKQSKGVADQTIANLRNLGRDLEADAMEHGVLNGFVMSEDLANAAMTLRDRSTVKGAAGAAADIFIPGHSAIADIGGKMFGGLEQRMRFGYFKDLVQNQGKTAEEAAAMVADRFLDYAATSAGNKQLRQVFPFAQFVVKSAKQQGKMLMENPAVLPAVAALYGGDDLPDYARQQAHIGNVLPGMAPTDVFNTMPDITGSDSMEAFIQSAKPLASAAHPLIGAAIGLGTGVDTFTGRPYLKDARVPFTGGTTRDRTPADTAWGLGEDVGILQPLAGPTQQAKSLGRMEPGTAALRYATGVNVLPSQDPTTLEKQASESALRADPRVSEFRSLYSKSQDPELQQALTRLREVQRELKQKADSTAPLAVPSVIPR